MASHNEDVNSLNSLNSHKPTGLCACAHHGRPATRAAWQVDPSLCGSLHTVTDTGHTTHGSHGVKYGVGGRFSCPAHIAHGHAYAARGELNGNVGLFSTLSRSGSQKKRTAPTLGLVGWSGPTGKKRSCPFFLRKHQKDRVEPETSRREPAKIPTTLRVLAWELNRRLGVTTL